MTDAQGDSTQIAHALGQLGLYLRSQQWRAETGAALTPTQVGVLSALNRHGPARVRALAGQLGTRHATMSEVVATLVRRGLVAKERDPDDARAVRIALTAAGAEVAADRDRVPPALAQAIDQLPAADRAAFKRTLATLIRQLQLAGEIAPQRMCVTCRFFRPHVHADARAPHHCAFVDAPFGDRQLLFDCPDQEEAGAADRRDIWSRFRAGTPPAG
jgi:DNA-binding MarR family transcriptional regulator